MDNFFNISYKTIDFLTVLAQKQDGFLSFPSGKIQTRGTEKLQGYKRQYRIFYNNIMYYLDLLHAKEARISTNLNKVILFRQMDTSNLNEEDFPRATLKNYVNLFSVYATWVHDDCPEKLQSLATLLLNKGKELEIIPEDKNLGDFV